MLQKSSVQPNLKNNSNPRLLMKLWRFSALLCLVVVAAVAALFYLRGPEVFTLERIAGPRLPVSDFVTGEIPDGATPIAQAGSPLAVPEKPPGPVPTFGNGPGTPPPQPRLFAAKGAPDPQKLAAYRAAVDGVTVIGCSHARQAALKIAGENALRTVSSGDTLHFAGDLKLVARIVDASRCRIVLLDHGEPVGEVASF